MPQTGKEIISVLTNKRKDGRNKIGFFLRKPHGSFVNIISGSQYHQCMKTSEQTEHCRYVPNSTEFLLQKKSSLITYLKNASALLSAE